MKIFLCEDIHPDAFHILNMNFEIINNIKYIKDCEIIISRNLKINKDFIDQCQSLKLIIIHGSGYDDVDIQYAKKKNIHLANTPGQNTLSVSELIIAMMLELSRKTYTLQKDFCNGQIQEVAPIHYLGHEISYKTFGMIGVGSIASTTAKILQDGFHMHCIGYSRSLTPQKAHELGIEYCSTMDEVLQKSDYISLGTALTPDTYHMISYSHFSLMKPSAYLINTSRGAIINEDALYDALVHNKIAGAAIDVLENEPVDCNHRLLKLDNVIYTPHIGGSTDESLKRVGMKVVEIALCFSRHELCEHLVF